MADNEKPEDTQLDTWRKKIEIIGIDIKSLNRENETGRLMLRTTFMNQHFINELDKIGLQHFAPFVCSNCREETPIIPEKVRAGDQVRRSPPVEEFSSLKRNIAKVKMSSPYLISA